MKEKLLNLLNDGTGRFRASKDASAIKVEFPLTGTHLLIDNHTY